MDISEIVVQYGAEYKNDPKARQRLANKLYNNNSAWDKFWRKVPTESTSEDWGMASHDEVLQPYQENWTPKGQVTALPNPIKLFWGKADLADVPDRLVNSWMGFLRESEINDPSKYSFVRWWIEDHILPRLHQDRYLQWGFLGQYVAPTPGIAGAAIETGDGARKIIRNHVTAGNIVPWVGGTFPTTASDMVTYVENFWKNMPEQYQQQKFQLAMRKHNYDLYVEGRRTKYNNNWPAEAKLNTVWENDNVEVVPFGNMGSSNLIWASQRENRMTLQKGGVKRNLLRVETALRKVFLFTDFHEGYGFDDPREVFTNDQDLS